MAVAPTRDFCISLFSFKIEATIRNIGDMIGWEDDGNTVGPVAFAAKRCLLRFIPYMLPYKDEAVLYRFVLEHSDFGVQNMPIATNANGQPRATSLYDWETGCVVPALLSAPPMVVTVDLISDEDAQPAITRVKDDVTTEQRTEYMKWSAHYFDRLFHLAPSYELAIRAGKNARHL